MGWLCKHLGHKMVTVIRRSFQRPAPADRSFRVADSVVDKRVECKRCGFSEQEWEEIGRTGIQSLTLASTRMEELDQTGILVRSRTYYAVA